MNVRWLLAKFLLGLLILAFLKPPGASAQGAGAAEANAMLVILIEGTVEVAPAGTDNWAPARLNQKLQIGDKLRTGKLSRATLRSTAAGDMPVRESSLMTINAPRAGSDRPVVELVKGFFYFFTRGQPTDLDFKNRLASAAARGTEFAVFIDENNNDRIEITVFDGAVDLNNAQGSATATNGEQAVAAAGQAPATSRAINAFNRIQWVLYYPGVLDVDELPWADADKNALSDSLAAYRSGDVVRALNTYPANRQPASDTEKTYRAALMLVVGEVEQATPVLDSLSAPSEFSQALRKLIVAVRNEQWTDTTAPKTASGWVAESYYRQSRVDLEGALAAARAATQARPNFGFAWARVAELEFSFGRIDEALAALEKALALSPRHASAMALKGFLLSAQNKIPAAIRQFEEAIATDGALADAWLGRGLCRIRSGDEKAGREDLRTAAALEPNRAVLRSYLAKAFSDAGQDGLARHELELSRKLDPNDPTVWLYGALHHQQQNRINEAIRELERSKDLNANRAVYRSQMLLDQDQAVRSANLASIYYDAGMTDVSVREAGRAVSSDYGNYSAHLFLANSYDRLRDPRQTNLRYETPTFAEYLIANLLAPVGAGTLSPAISQQEYSKLFERDHLGVSSFTEYQSSGAWFENGAQYGTMGNSSYSLQGTYRSDPGQRPNNDVEQRQFSAQFKQQVTPHDTAYLEVTDARTTGGDLTQYYDQRSASRGLRTLETQEPILLVGWHHEWSPGNHTVFLGARLDDNFTVELPHNPVSVLARLPAGRILDVTPAAFTNHAYRSQLTLYSAELQHIVESPKHTTVLGARVQAGEFETKVTQTNIFDPSGLLDMKFGSHQDVNNDFQRTTFYGYHSWRIVPSFQLVGGVAYDYLAFPENFRFAPISPNEEKTSHLSPKAGFIWTPDNETTFRFAYTRSVAGASIDQSFQIEPSQVAGFNQSFRSLIPESVAAANAAAEFETFDLSLEHKFPTETYVGLSGQILNSDVNRTVGTVAYGAFDQPPAPLVRDSLHESLDFTEQSALLTLNQLVARDWALGASYRVSRADLKDRFPEFRVQRGAVSSFRPRSDYEATLHQVVLYAIYNHPSGLFGTVQALWEEQWNDLPKLRGDQFWQFNAFVGYRFWQRRAELSVGVVNIGDVDYKLNPLNLYGELPRERTFVTRFNFKF